MWLSWLALACAPAVSLFDLQDLPPDDACPGGGVAVHVGTDRDRDGVLSPEEIEQTSVICSSEPGPTGPTGADGADGADGVDGADGADGADGEDGADGADGLFEVRVADPAICPNGGVELRAGTDRDGDGLLGDDELSSLAVVCDGADGADGQAPPLRVELEPIPPGPTCDWGGAQLKVGLDADGDGHLASWEISSSATLCQGDGALSASPGVTVVPLAPGATCPDGGVEVRAGLDLNEDGDIDDDELWSAAPVCSGLRALGILEGSYTIANSVEANALADFSVITGNLTVSGVALTRVALPWLREVRGDLTLSGGQLGTVDLSGLERVGGKLRLSGSALAEVRLDALAYVDDDLVVDSASLSTVTFPALRGVGGSYLVTGATLESAESPRLEGVGLDLNLAGAKLARVDVDSLAEIGRDLNATGARLLHLDAPRLEGVVGKVVASGAVLTELRLPALLDVTSATISGASIAVLDLEGLQTVDGALSITGTALEAWPTLASLASAGSVGIVANPRLGGDATGALPALREVGTLVLAGSASAQLPALASLERVGGLSVREHPAATAWPALARITQIELQNLSLRDLPALRGPLVLPPGSGEAGALTLTGVGLDALILPAEGWRDVTLTEAPNLASVRITGQGTLAYLNATAVGLTQLEASAGLTRIGAISLEATALSRLTLAHVSVGSLRLTQNARLTEARWAHEAGALVVAGSPALEVLDPSAPARLSRLELRGLGLGELDWPWLTSVESSPVFADLPALERLALPNTAFYFGLHYIPMVVDWYFRCDGPVLTNTPRLTHVDLGGARCGSITAPAVTFARLGFSAGSATYDLSGPGMYYDFAPDALIEVADLSERTRVIDADGYVSERGAIVPPDGARYRFPTLARRGALVIEAESRLGPNPFPVLEEIDRLWLVLGPTHADFSVFPSLRAIPQSLEVELADSPMTACQVRAWAAGLEVPPPTVVVKRSGVAQACP